MIIIIVMMITRTGAIRFNAIVLRLLSSSIKITFGVHRLLLDGSWISFGSKIESWHRFGQMLSRRGKLRIRFFRCLRDFAQIRILTLVDSTSSDTLTLEWVGTVISARTTVIEPEVFERGIRGKSVLIHIRKRKFRFRVDVVYESDGNWFDSTSDIHHLHLRTVFELTQRVEVRGEYEAIYFDWTFGIFQIALNLAV